MIARSVTFALFVLLFVAGLVVAGIENTTYAVVNKVQLDTAISEGRINQKALMARMKGYPYCNMVVSNDGKLCIMKASVQGDIAYLRARAAEEGIDYSEYNFTAIQGVVSGTNWISEAGE